MAGAGALREVEMSPLAKVYACVALLIASALSSDCAFAAPAINYNASKSNTGNGTVGQSTTCPSDQSWDATARKCVALSSINYNASKSNTGNVTFQGNGGAANGGRVTTSARYHCGKGEYMLNNGDCVPNPPSKPND
jgi:hypothetical protein